MLAAARDEAYRARLVAVADAVEHGELAAAEAADLERVLELGLQAGRIRAIYGAGGEQAALRLFRRLPARRRADRERALRLRGAGDAQRPAARLVPDRARSAPACTGSRSSPAAPRSRSGSTGSGVQLASIERLSDAEKRHYIACIDLDDRSVLVVGAGRVALEKVRGLLDCGAAVTVVAPEVSPEVARAPGRGAATRVSALRPRRPLSSSSRRRPTRPSTRPSSRDAEARSLLCNVVDVPELCSFILPALHRQDPITVSVSTGGASPALAQRLRDEIARDRAAGACGARRPTARAAPLGEAAPARPTRPGATTSPASCAEELG